MNDNSPHAFAVGDEIKRSQLHDLLGGQRQGGMSTPSHRLIILLFTTSHGGLYGYEDCFQADGMFWYTGEGQVGDMDFVRANRVLRDHEVNERRVFLFEQTRKSYVRFVAEVRCDGHHFELRPDRNGQQRRAIVFHLEVLPAWQKTESPARSSIEEDEVDRPSSLSRLSLSELRSRALSSASSSPNPKRRSVVVQNRAEAIRQYALKRAAGICESCLNPAPFLGKKGPFLEVHHLHRISDGGPDHPVAVAAICPNCHREIHAGVNGSEKNGRLVESVRTKEAGNPAGT
jgi:5-methylcytosine-specific restriction enzyme A